MNVYIINIKIFVQGGMSLSEAECPPQDLRGHCFTVSVVSHITKITHSQSTNLRLTQKYLPCKNEQ